MPRIVVLGIGNTLMGDDGVGAAVARSLVRLGLPHDVAVLESPNADMGLVRHFRESERVYVVDAIDAGAEPGAVFRFSPDEAGVTSLRSNNIHGMGVGFLITNARLMGADPSVVVFGIQVADIRPRPDTLTDEVSQAAEAVAQMLRAELVECRSA